MQIDQAMYDGHVDAKISGAVRAKKVVSRPFLTSAQKLANADLRVRRNNVEVMRVQTLHARFLSIERVGSAGRAHHAELECSVLPPLRAC